jgi:hypothetical protein
VFFLISGNHVDPDTIKQFYPNNSDQCITGSVRNAPCLFIVSIIEVAENCIALSLSAKDGSNSGRIWELKYVTGSNIIMTAYV